MKYFRKCNGSENSIKNRSNTDSRSKAKLKRHLNETNIHKNKLQKIISRSGEEPTGVKADLSLSLVSTTMAIENNFLILQSMLFS